jgi:hypothetical protein
VGGLLPRLVAAGGGLTRGLAAGGSWGDRERWSLAKRQTFHTKRDRGAQKPPFSLGNPDIASPNLRNS